MKLGQEENEKLYKTACRGSHGGCGLLVKVKDNKIVSIEPDPDSPINLGEICNATCTPSAVLELLYHPDRILYPMKREGARGEGKWKRISWDEAYNIIAKKLLELKKEYGAKSIALAQGTGRDYAEFLYRFANAFGTPNVVSPGNVCYFPRVVASLIVCGGFPVCDYGNFPKCIMVIGCNPHITSPEEYKAPVFKRALEKAEKLIVIDPRRTELAERADIWAQLRPGTDAALLLGMMNVIIEEELWDKEFVEKYSIGFDKLRERVKEYPLDKVEEITWVSKGKIKQMAEVYATTKPAALQWGQATDGSINAFSSAIAMLHLIAMTGNLDVKGGNVIYPRPPVNSLSRFALHRELPSEVSRERLGASDYPVAAMGMITPAAVFVDAVLTGKPYPIKALLIFGSNPLVTWPDSEKTKRALMRLDFLAVTDLFMTPTAEIADIVLPAAHWLEVDDVASYWMRPGYVVARRKIVQTGECKSDHEILNELGKRVGCGKYFFKDLEEAWNYILEPSGMTWKEFKEVGILQAEIRYEKYKVKGFSTPSKKYEFYPKRIEELGKDPLPSYSEPPESPVRTPSLAKKYPFILTTGARQRCYFHSEGRQSKVLRNMCPGPYAEIHPEVAKALNISDEDFVFIETRTGKIKMRARVTDRIHPKVISIPHAWWFPEKPAPEYGYRDANANMLVSADPPFDPYLGSVSFRALLCKVEKVKE
jgi:anaerobic selenocysteine-containing dehydrogenase